MTLEIEILSGRKGSNPGGMCIVRSASRTIHCYVKYCPGSNLPKNSHLDAAHQPIYEAITNVMARKLGLNTPNFFVLSYRGEPVKKLNGEEIFKNGRKYYFVSELLANPGSVDNKKLREVMDKERVYRDFLGIWDVENRADNYFFYSDSGLLKYIDLGCSFVWAKGSIITIKKRIQQELLDAQRLKEAKKRIVGHSLILPNGAQIRLEDIANMLFNIQIPVLNPEKRENIVSLLSQDEIEEIRKIFVLEIFDVFKKYRHSDPIN